MLKIANMKGEIKMESIGKKRRYEMSQNLSVLQRGDIFYVDLDKGGKPVGYEIQKPRPCVVIQCAEASKSINTVLVVPITSNNIEKYSHLRLRNFLDAECSTLIIEQMRAVDKSRLISRIGRFPDSRVEELNRKIMVATGIITSADTYAIIKGGRKSAI